MHPLQEDWGIGLLLLELESDLFPVESVLFPVTVVLFPVETVSFPLEFVFLSIGVGGIGEKL